MTETPPTMPQPDPTSPGEPPVTEPTAPKATPPTTPEAPALQTTGEGADALSFADHQAYSQTLYQQPPWIVDAVYQANNLDRNQKYPQGTISSLIDTLMSGQDARYANQEETP
jgi:hypothetical protein